MIHQPKGSMCAVCQHKYQDCSHLPFDTMNPISKSTDLERVIVKCTEFKKETEDHEIAKRKIGIRHWGDFCQWFKLDDVAREKYRIN